MRAEMTTPGLYIVSGLLGIAMSIPATSASVNVWNTLAQAGDVLPEIPKGAETIATASLSAVIAWLLSKTIPSIISSHETAMGKLSDAMTNKLDEVNDTIRSHGDRTHELLVLSMRQQRRQSQDRKKPPESGQA
jgi:hypothetical protein